MKKRIDVTKNWKKLKDCLLSKLTLANSALKNAKKEESYTECIKYEEQINTINWILEYIEVIEDIESLEETGELL